MSSHSHRSRKRDPVERLSLVCVCARARTLQPSYIPAVETYRLTHGVCDTGRGAAVRVYLLMNLATSSADRDYGAGRHGALLSALVTDARFRHACKCCTAVHAVACRCGVLKHPIGWHAVTRAGPFAVLGYLPAAGRTCLLCKLVPCSQLANGPGTGGRLGVAADLNNRTRQVALAGCGACCTVAVASGRPDRVRWHSWWASACVVASALQRASCTLVGSNPRQCRGLAV